eukprot:CAMPEP_0198305968 /NCGR_PEP_ID=MMETSP1449-20131203/58178_1 /TAXON_ID=420275 /ORGANISM="Attheya septentrionalis, Strain CCMP2084" /LENGTH=958 /DNA_ID=CAMNT_0044008513 /DNA_START=147 /DNA_END=3020 /DNA_ORIENTATION=+
MSTEHRESTHHTPIEVVVESFKNEAENHGRRGSCFPRIVSQLCHGWNRKIIRQDNGGDFPRRIDGAVRAALACGTYFSVLMLSGQQTLPTVWLGNLFLLIVTLKDSVGASIPFAARLIRDMVLTMGVSFVVNIILHSMGTRAFSILLPPVAGAFTFFIMSCPYLACKNYMVIIMWIVIQLGLHDEDLTNSHMDQAKLVLGLFGTCLAGIMTAIIFMTIPMPRPALASNNVNQLLAQSDRDMQILLYSTKVVWLNAGTSSNTVRRAHGILELAVERLKCCSRKLKANANAVEVERNIARFFAMKKGNDYRKGSLIQWSNFICDQQIHVDTIHIAVTQRLLEGGHTAYNEQLREAKISLASNMKETLDSLVDIAIESIQVCTAVAESKDNGKPTKFDQEDSLHERIEEILVKTRHAWGLALPKAESIMLNSDLANVPSLAFFVRRMHVFYGIYKFCDGLKLYMKNADQVTERKSTWYLFKSYVTQPWPPLVGKHYRLPFKASVGMIIASLWAVVPFLYNRSSPFEIWPALTVASVNLATAGASYNKCIDRLWAILLASAFALLVQFFTGEHLFLEDYVKLPIVVSFTFVAIYLRNPSRPYPATYAAFCIGAILYGSIKNDFDVEGYVTDRIVLTFVGVIIFVLVEFLLFPRSSRKSVQVKAKTFLTQTHTYMIQALTTLNSMEHLANHADTKSTWMEQTQTPAPADVKTVTDDFLCNVDILQSFQLDAQVSMTKANNELQSAVNEPCLGLSHPINQSLWISLMGEEMQCNKQMQALTEAIKSLSEFYLNRSDPLPLMRWGWPALYKDIVEQVVDQLSVCCSRLDGAFPDGQIQPQNQNLIKANQATAAFRDFEDVRLNILAIWSKRYRSFLQSHHQQDGVTSYQTDKNQTDSLRVMIRLGLIVSIVIELCRNLENTGRSLEAITREFPTSAMDRYQSISTLLSIDVRSSKEKSVKSQSLW